MKLSQAMIRDINVQIGSFGFSSRIQGLKTLKENGTNYIDVYESMVVAVQKAEWTINLPYSVRDKGYTALRMLRSEEEEF